MQQQEEIEFEELLIMREKKRICIIYERENGTTKSPLTEDRGVRRPAHEERRRKTNADRRVPSQTSIATPRTRFLYEMHCGNGNH